MADIFISYARQDRSMVEYLAKALENGGWSVWWDRDIPVAKPWHQVIEEAIDNAKCVIVVWSKASVSSDWVLAEAEEGLKRRILLPIILDQAKIPLLFRSLQAASLIQWDGNTSGSEYKRLVEAIKTTLDQPLGQGLRSHKFGEMVTIAAGLFQYGEHNQTRKIDKDFEIDIYPVTNRQFDDFIESKGYEKNEYWSREGLEWRKDNAISKPEYYLDNDKWNQPEHPVVGVSYYEAEAFAKWNGKTLPTEVQWERAARGTDGRRYPWGDEFDKERCNTKESGIAKTTRVTRYPNGLSPDGCYDMAGNVWEWTKSKYKRSNYVQRGGCWLLNRFDAQCAHRVGAIPSYRNISIGFRCVRNLGV